MSATPKSQQKPIVFVVDDDVSVRESLELLIQFAGWWMIDAYAIWLTDDGGNTLRDNEGAGADGK